MGSFGEGDGGGMFNVFNCNIIGVNCTFAQNSAEYGNALSCDLYDQTKKPANIELINRILWDDGNEIWNNNNSAITITYSDIKDGFPGKGNIALDPLFVNPGYWDPNQTPDDPNDDFWVDGDYHLRSRAGRFDPNSKSWVQDDVNSPCIDACDPMTAISHEPLPHGGIINMGAYGGTIEASKSLYNVNHFQQAFYPDPDDGAVDVIADTVLSWVSDTNAVTHEVYFGTSYLPSFIQKQHLTEFDPGALEPNTQYYWRIDDIDKSLNRVTGNIWTFQTDSNDLIINSTYDPNPAYAAIDVNLDTLLSWSSGLDTVVYDVYFGTDLENLSNATTENPLGVLVEVAQDFNFYEPGILEYGQMYFWRIDETDSEGTITAGDIWVFTTSTGGGGGGKARACFTGKTDVWINGSTVPISTAVTGQNIGFAADGDNIEKLQEHQGTFDLFDILLESGCCLSVADEHYFMMKTGRWISSKNLTAGMKLKTSKGSIEIKSITKQPNPFTGRVYNLKIEGSDQYIVGEDAVIVRDY